MQNPCKSAESEPEPGKYWRFKIQIWFCALNFVVAIAIRLLAARGELWLDEAWSWMFAADANSLIDAFDSIRHDNNHPLNTAWMIFCGPDAPAISYRFGAIFFGSIGAVALGAFAKEIGMKGWGLCGLFAAVLSPMVELTSQARGYGYAFGLAAMTAWASASFLRSGNSIRYLFFLLAILLLPFAHGTGIFPAFGLAIFAWVQLLLRNGDGNGYRRTLIIIPALFSCVITVAYYRDIKVGGGPEDGQELLGIATGLISTLAGGPKLVGLVSMTAAISYLSLVMFSVVRYCKQIDWWIFATISGVSAITAGYINPTGFITDRYFLIPMAFSIPFAIDSLMAIWEMGRITKVGIAAIVIAASVGNFLNLAPVLRYGHDDFSDGFSQLFLSEIPTNPIGVDHTFRVPLMLEYSRLRSKIKQPLETAEIQKLESGWPDLLIFHSVSNDIENPIPPEVIHPAEGIAYMIAWKSRNTHQKIRWYFYARTESQ